MADSHQAPDGHWSLDGFNQPHCKCRGTGPGERHLAATAFGLLPLLGAGNTHKNPKADQYGKTSRRGSRYL